jgi:hypothetical protein
MTVVKNEKDWAKFKVGLQKKYAVPEEWQITFLGRAPETYPFGVEARLQDPAPTISCIFFTLEDAKKLTQSANER